MEALISSVIVGGLALAGTVITCITTSKNTNNKINETLNIKQAVTDTKIEELTREVREHNGFARRLPVVEEQIKVINHRLNDIEGVIK